LWSCGMLESRIKPQADRLLPEVFEEDLQACRRKEYPWIMLVAIEHTNNGGRSQGWGSPKSDLRDCAMTIQWLLEYLKKVAL